MKYLKKVVNLPTELEESVLYYATEMNKVAIKGKKKEDPWEVVPNAYIYSAPKYYQKLVVYGEPIEQDVVDLNNNEWIANGSDSDYNYYKSTNADEHDSYTQCCVRWSGVDTITLKYRCNNDSESKYDYLCIGELDGDKFSVSPNYNDSNVQISTHGESRTEYSELTINCDEGEHHVWICYKKDDTFSEGEDTGFIGVPKSLTYFEKPILKEKQGAELPMTYANGGVSVEGNKTYDITFATVTLPNGKDTIVYTDYQKTEKTITYEYVDLGLPSGLKWATTNLGASAPEESGVYVQWADTSGITANLLGKYGDENFFWKTTPYQTQDTTEYDETKFTKYLGSTTSSYKDSSATDEDALKIVLDDEDDIAHVNMGGDWRMPTEAEMRELYNNTTSAWTEVNGVSGMKFTSKSDSSKYIFIPAVGGCYFGSVYYVGSDGVVWSSSLSTSGPGYAWYLRFNSGYVDTGGGYRCSGFTVRGVSGHKNSSIVDEL